MTIDGKSSATLTASVMDKLDLSDPRSPPDEYALHEPPPAYETFEEAYKQWRVADKAKRAVVALDNDPAIAAYDKELKEARDMLQSMKEESEAAFKALHTKRSPLASFLSFGKSKRKSLRAVPSNITRGHSSPAPSVDEINVGVNEIDTSQLKMTRSTSTTESRSHADGNHLATDEFRRAREAEMKQDLVVRGLEEKVAEFKRNKEALSKAASPGNLAWIQLRRIADETLLSTPEFATGMGALMEKLEGVENAYNVAKKTATDFTRACLAVRSSHSYFQDALRICDSVRGLSIGGLGGSIGDMGKMIEYRASVTLASKAQICLKEMFRVLEPHEHMIPEDRMKDYKELKKIGVMQMSKIYNLMFGGRMLTDGVAGSVKLMLQRQETAFAHLTYLGVWVQNRAPVCTAEEEMASTSRDDVRREVASFWNANINCSGQI